MDGASLLLAIESSTRWLGVALLRGVTLVAKRREENSAPGSERLLPLIDDLLRAESCSLDSLDGYAVSVGPGSFTGLRVGIATVKGLAFGSSVTIAPVSTLDALAHGARVEDGVVVAALDAHRGELYASATRFSSGAAPTSLVPPQVVTAAALGALLVGASPSGSTPGAGSITGTGSTSESITWVGDAPAAARAFPHAVEVREPPEGAPDAEWIGRLGARSLTAGEGIDPAALAPRYLRRAEAEVKRTGEAFEDFSNGV